MRTFEKTHPWISFRVDLRKAPPDLWLLLGEAASKCEHIARVPLEKATAEKFHILYLAKGAAATTAIEGNSLSEAEVLKAAEGSLTVPQSKQYLKQDVDNILAAFTGIARSVSDGTLQTITPQTICDYNRLILEKLPLEEGVVPGGVRSGSVVVGNVYRGAPAEDCASSRSLV
jgi:hypothetical protein